VLAESDFGLVVGMVATATEYNRMVSNIALGLGEAMVSTAPPVCNPDCRERSTWFSLTQV